MIIAFGGSIVSISQQFQVYYSDNFVLIKLI